MHCLGVVIESRSWQGRLQPRGSYIVPRHDPTNSFKAYRRDFLARTPIESKAGFCLGLELTVKAFAVGGRVEELPATWTDRSAGTGRFQLFRWLQSYLHWYLWAFGKRWLG